MEALMPDPARACRALTPVAAAMLEGTPARAPTPVAAPMLEGTTQARALAALTPVAAAMPQDTPARDSLWPGTRYLHVLVDSCFPDLPWEAPGLNPGQPLRWFSRLAVAIGFRPDPNKRRGYTPTPTQIAPVDLSPTQIERAELYQFKKHLDDLLKEARLRLKTPDDFETNISVTLLKPWQGVLLKSAIAFASMKRPGAIQMRWKLGVTAVDVAMENQSINSKYVRLLNEFTWNMKALVDHARENDEISAESANVAYRVSQMGGDPALFDDIGKEVTDMTRDPFLLNSVYLGAMQNYQPNYAELHAEKLFADNIKGMLHIPYSLRNSKLELQCLQPFQSISGCIGLNRDREPSFSISSFCGVKDLKLYNVESLGFGGKLHINDGDSWINCSAGVSVSSLWCNLGLTFKQPGLFTATCSSRMGNRSTVLGGYISYSYEEDRTKFAAGVQHSVDSSMYLKSCIGSDKVLRSFVSKSFGKSRLNLVAEGCSVREFADNESKVSRVGTPSRSIFALPGFKSWHPCCSSRSQKLA
uniref:Uncharacterized protein n=1 Tax=Aegilops tauschii TaxID=37682 RepID=M8AQX7_AEGTA